MKHFVWLPNPKETNESLFPNKLVCFIFSPFLCGKQFHVHISWHPASCGMMMVWSASGSLVINKMSGCPPRPVSPHHCPGHRGNMGTWWHHCDKFISRMGNIEAGRMGAGLGTRGDPLSIWHNDRLHKTSLIQRLQSEGLTSSGPCHSAFVQTTDSHYSSKPDRHWTK